MARPNEQVRAFVALLLPDDVREFCERDLREAQRRLGSSANAVRWVAPEGLHLTLKFLGNVPVARLPDLTEHLAVELAGQARFQLGVGRLGVFPNPRAPRVIVLDITGDRASLADCRERVEIATEPLGFAREGRPFRPHLTLGRVREGATARDAAEIGRLAAEWSDRSGPTFEVDSANLMQSQLGPGGARYTRLAEFPFAGKM